MKINCPSCGKTLARLDLENIRVKIQFTIIRDECGTENIGNFG